MATVAWQQRRVFALAVVVGMLVGALLLIGWLGMGRDTRADAPALQSDRARLINLLAETYWNSGDLEQALRSLEGWDQEELATLLATMAEQTTDSQALARLRSFEEALALPMPPLTLASLYKQGAIAWSANLSLAMILAAVLCRVWPLSSRPALEQLFRKKTLETAQVVVAPQAGAAQGLASAGEGSPSTQAGGQDVSPQAAPGQQPQVATLEGPSEVAEQAADQPPGPSGQQAAAQAADQQAGAPAASQEAEDQASPEAQGQEGDKAAAAEGQKADGQEEGQQQGGSPKAAAKDGEQQAASGEQPEEKEEEQGLEGLDKESDEIQNILASIFEEEDESLQAIAVLCQGLDDVDVADLARRLQEVAEGLRQMNRVR